jgi:hypothetical protein
MTPATVMTGLSALKWWRVRDVRADKDADKRNNKGANKEVRTPKSSSIYPSRREELIPTEAAAWSRPRFIVRLSEKSLIMVLSSKLLRPLAIHDRRWEREERKSRPAPPAPRQHVLPAAAPR